MIFMGRILFFIFAFWFLLLPFSGISFLYFNIGGLAVDKVMAPVLILVWLGFMLSGKYKLGKSKKILLFHVFVFMIIRNISFIDNMALFSQLIWRDAIMFGYFALPVLYIEDLKKVDWGAKIVSVNAVVACLSAFLVAFSLIELPYDRFSESRIGFEGIRKSIGLITAYGDVTQLAAFFLMLGFFIPEKLQIKKMRSPIFIKTIVLLVVVIGLIGNQSRSYLFSMFVAFGAALFFSYRSKKSANTVLIDILTILGVIFIIPVMLYMLSEIVSLLSGLGGKEAMGSAGARLDQYETAFYLIKENPIFGVGSEFYIKNVGLAHGVHNLWLGQLTRGGFVSVLLLIVLLFNIFKRCIRLYKNDYTSKYAQVLTGYLAAVFVSTLFYPADSDIFWALLGVCTSIIYVLNDHGFKYSDVPENAVVECGSNRILRKKSIRSIK